MDGMYMNQTKVPKISFWDRILIGSPVVLRGLSGFQSALTSATITVVFSLTIYQAVLNTHLGYPSAFKTAIMLIGPLISGWQFVNINSTLSALFKEIESGNKIGEDGIEIGLATGESIEKQIYGSTTTFLRSIAGFIC